MGSTSYSADTYKTLISDSLLRGKDVFTYSSSIKDGDVEAKVHEKLDPSKLNKSKKNVRESLDSPEHPCSTPIAVLFDVTGSMAAVPKVFVSKLGKLMSFLVKKGYVSDPQVLFGAIGDAKSDKVPLQIGQFESGNEMDEALTSVYLESGGGGGTSESYELGMYYMARHTDLDSYNKRDEKGYLFLMGDETPYDEIDKSEVEKVIGDKLQEDIPTSKIIEELKQKFHLYWIMPSGTSHYDDKKVLSKLKSLFGQNLIFLENADNVTELIVSTIGINEGKNVDSISRDLTADGFDSGAVKSVSMSVAKLTAKALNKGILRGSKPKSGKKDSVETL